MASKKIGLVLALDGEKEFKDALKACKDEVKLYKESLGDLDKKMKDGQGTIDDYKRKQEELAKKQEAYVKQLDAAKTGLQNAEEAYQRQAKKLEELRDSLDKAKEAEQKMRDEGKEGTEEYRKQADQVDKLREAVAKQAANVGTAETRVNSWHKEVNTATREIENCDKELQQNKTDMEQARDATDRAGDEMKDFAGKAGEAATESGKLSISIGDMVKNKIIDMAGDALMNLGQKAVDAAKYIVDVGSSFEAQMSKVQAISGASAADAERLAGKAAEMGRVTKFTASEAGEAMEYMAMAGWKTEDMLGGIEGIMSLAAASGENLGTTSDIVTDALTAFGKSAGDAGKLADIMAAASSNANTNVGMMGETFKYAAPVAGALGYTMEDTSLAIGLMANAGIKASQAGTSIRAGLTNLVKPSEQAATAMTRYKIAVTDSDGSMLTFRDLIAHLRDRLGGLSENEQAAAAAAIFGKNAMSGWLAIINAAPADVEKLTSAIDNSAGAAGRMAELMQDNLQGKLTLLNSALEGLGVALYNYFSGPLQGAVELATDFINGITGLINPQKTELESFIDSINTSNEAVEKSIQHARDTVDNADLEVGKLETAEKMIGGVLDSCSQFNKIDLGDGEYQIVDATGRVVEQGFEPLTESINSTDDILAAFGSKGMQTDKIHDGTRAVATYFDDTGKKIGEYETTLDAAGKAVFKADGVEEGSKVVINAFDDSGESVLNFKTTMDDSGEIKFHTDGITSGIDTATEYIGHIEEKVITVEDRLKEFAADGINTEEVQRGVSAVVQIFDEAGNPVDTFQQNIEETGTVTIDSQNAKDGTDAIITVFNEASGQVESFKTALSDSVTEFDVSTITGSMEQVADETKNVVKVTDEFTKLQITTIINDLKDTVPELAGAWNELTGELDLSNDQLSIWMDNAKAVALQDALQSAVQELYETWADAQVNAYKAESALNEAIKEFNKENSTAYESWQQMADDGVFYGGYGKAAEAVRDAKDAVEECNGTLEVARGELETTATELEKNKDQFQKLGEAVGQNNTTLEEGKTALENEAAAADAAGESTEEAAKKQEKLNEKIAEAAKEYGDTQNKIDAFAQAQAELGNTEELLSWVETNIDKFEEFQKESDALFKSLSENLTGYVNAIALTDEEGNKSLDNWMQSMQEHKAEVEKWGEQMNYLASRIGKDFTQEMYDMLAQQGYEKSKETVELLCQGIDEESGQLSEQAKETARMYTENLADEGIIAEGVVAMTTAGKQLAEATNNGYAVSVEEFKATVQKNAEEAAGAASESAEQFEQAGEQAGEQQAKGLESKKNDVTSAAQTVTEAANTATEKAAENFVKAGRVASLRLSAGMNEKKNIPVDSGKKIVEEIKNEMEGAVDDIKNAGNSAMSGYASGLSSAQGEATNAAGDAMTDVKSRFGDATEDIRYAGENAISAYADAIWRGSGEALNAADYVGRTTKDNVEQYRNDWDWAGFNMVDGLARGIYNGEGLAVSAAITVARNALIAAKNELGVASPSKEFMKVGEFSDEGLALGFMSGHAEDAARESARKAMLAAKDELSGTYTTDLVSSVNFAGMTQMQRIMDAQVQTADLTGALRSMMGMAANMSALAESLTNPQAPNVTVMIGNREFKGYIVSTALDGMGQASRNQMLARGGMV